MATDRWEPQGNHKGARGCSPLGPGFNSRRLVVIEGLVRVPNKGLVSENHSEVEVGAGYTLSS